MQERYFSISKEDKEIYRNIQHKFICKYLLKLSQVVILEGV